MLSKSNFILKLKQFNWIITGSAFTSGNQISNILIYLFLSEFFGEKTHFNKMSNLGLEKSRGLCMLPGTILILRSSLSGFVSFLLKSQIWFEWDLGIDSKAEFCFTQFLYKPFQNNLYLHKVENFEIVTCSFKLKEENLIFNFRIKSKTLHRIHAHNQDLVTKFHGNGNGGLCSKFCNKKGHGTAASITSFPK